MEIDTALSSTSSICRSPKLDPNGNKFSVGVGKGTRIFISGNTVSAVLAGCGVGEGVPNVS